MERNALWKAGWYVQYMYIQDALDVVGETRAMRGDRVTTR